MKRHQNLGLKKRNGLEAGIARIVIIGVSIALIAGVAAFATQIFETSQSLQIVEENIEVKKIGDNAFIIGTITNRGSETINDLELQILNSSGTAMYTSGTGDISDTTIASGASVTMELVKINGTFVIGQELPMLLKGTTNDGSFVKDLSTEVKRG